MRIFSFVLGVMMAVQCVPAFAATHDLSKSARSFDFSNDSSNGLVQKAWASLASSDLEATEAYVHKTDQYYASKAKEMQSRLQDYASGSKENIFKYWALNDVGTAWFILGEAYRMSGNKEEAIRSFNKVISDFSYSQCWDIKGWFWKPAQAAKEKIAMIQSGLNLDFGDYTSSTLVQKAWASLATNDLKGVEAYVNKTDDLYASKAKEMQGSLLDYASGNNDEIFKYWALNDVGTAWFILGEAYRNAGQNENATRAYNKVINEFSFAQCWDPQGWFWNPMEAAQQKLMQVGINPVSI
ncbi:MAG: tetratricopeptide repeat protein [Candidatus Omnitrophica bacterium]|nr:tetratricopeptide repeat protein [Candidatus Omnitrophota bacterium]